MIAVNDGIILRNHIPRILKKHFREKSYYVDLLDLFNEVMPLFSHDKIICTVCKYEFNNCHFQVEFQTACGQMIDLITTIEGEKELSKYSLPL